MTVFPSSKHALHAEFLVQQDQQDASRPLIVFLHGVTRCWQTFIPLMNCLSPRYISLGIDFPGHGSSPRQEQYLVQDHVTALLRWLNYDFKTLTNRNKLIIYGHSLGGMVATAVAAELPEMVEAIILEDPPFEAMGQQIKGTGWQKYFAKVRQYASLECSEQKLYEELKKMTWENPATNQTLELAKERDDVSIRFMARCLDQLDPNTMEPIISGDWLNGFALAQLLPKIKCPTLLLQADPNAEGTLSNQDVHQMQSSIEHVVVKQFPQAGHLLHQSRLTEITQTVSLFLESLPPVGS
ncbi:MAG: alpha/beta hydrolase [Planctomycetaceae bacterium]|nr:alpha/beta hydrolase [Planctomycetaceae bacterium]